MEVSTLKLSPQKINLSTHKNGYKSISFSDTELMFGLVVAESDPQVVLGALIDCVRYSIGLKLPKFNSVCVLANVFYKTLDKL